MSGIFGTEASLASDLNLLLQLVILAILIVGFKFGKEKTGKSLKRHGNMMAIVVVLNAIGIIFVMAPSFFNYLSTPVSELSTTGILSTSLHALFGGLAELFGIAFAFNKKPKKIRLWMRLTMLFWIVSMILGFSLYLQVAGII
ncbi:hypothetical protein GWO13_00670 [Candidatus Bathyarchaeota archaeon]|nr:hypothetical protein [Candidatus Bathyarchaeota archaeon]